MKWFNKWLMPGVFTITGIALLLGWIRPGLTADPGLRLTMGMVIILFGVLRFATSRADKPTSRRRFGGTRRPWEE
jgi:hypothetical protein